MRILKLIALGCVPALTLCVGVLLLQISGVVEYWRGQSVLLAAGVEDTLAQVNAPCSVQGCGTVAGLNRSVQRLGSTAAAASLVLQDVDGVVGTVNRPCGTKLPCGTLADVAKTLGTARGVMGQTEIAVHSFDAHQDEFYRQEQNLAAAAQTMVADADELITSRVLTESLHNLDTTTAALASATQHADGVLADVHEEADKLVHPAKKKVGFWGALAAGAAYVHKLLPPLF